MRAKGFQLPQAKLNEKLVAQMRHDYFDAKAQIEALKPKASIKALAEQYGVDRTTIRRALDGSNWGHVR